MPNIIVYDTEATCWEGSLKSHWGEDWQEPEIIQIAALCIDSETFEETAPPFDILIKPALNPVLSDYCVDLTSITNEQLEKEGVDFKTAAEAFNAYCKGSEIYSYGPDHWYLNYNRKELYQLDSIVPEFEGNDLRPLFLEIDPNCKSVNSGALSKHFNLPFEANEHYALDDCRSIAESLKHLKKHKKTKAFFGI